MNPEDEPQFYDPICSECKEPCKGKWVDFGVGPGEFWGRPFNDVDIQFVSDCCEEEIEERQDDDNYMHEDL